MTFKTIATVLLQQENLAPEKLQTANQVGKQNYLYINEASYNHLSSPAPSTSPLTRAKHFDLFLRRK